MKASEIPGDNIHSDVQMKLESDPTYQGKYHTSYVTKYLTKATHSAEKQKRTIIKLSSPSHLHEKRTTETAFRENALHGHLAVAIWRDCLKTDPPALDPTTHGWYHPEGSAALSPTIVLSDSPLAPVGLRKLLKCGCSNETQCANKRCSCKANGLSCTIFCHCRGEDDCNNK